MDSVAPSEGGEMAAPMLPCVDRPKKVWYGSDDEWELLWIHLDMEAQLVYEQWLHKLTGKEVQEMGM